MYNCHFSFSNSYIAIISWYNMDWNFNNSRQLRQQTIFILYLVFLHYPYLTFSARISHLLHCTASSVLFFWWFLQHTSGRNAAKIYLLKCQWTSLQPPIVYQFFFAKCSFQISARDIRAIAPLLILIHSFSVLFIASAWNNKVPNHWPTE